MCVCVCVFCFFIPVVVVIFDIGTIFITRPPPIVCGVFCHIWGAIMESVRHLSFCKNRDFYGGDSEKKWGMFFLWG